MLNKSSASICLMVLAIVGVGSTPPVADAALILTNGNFEAPDLPSGGSQAFNPGISAGGWTNSSSSGHPAYLLNENISGFPDAHDGDQMLQLDHRSNPHLVYQSLGTTDELGDITLSAWFAARNLNIPGGPPGTMTFSLRLLTGSPGSFTVLADSGPLTHAAAESWVEHSTTAYNVPAGTPIYAGLLANHYSDDPVVLTVIDGVQINVVPEPAAMALLGLGAVAIASGRRR